MYGNIETTYPHPYAGSGANIAHVQEIAFVKLDQAKIAKDIETALLSISEDAGILFVSVSVTPTTSGQIPSYDVLVGCRKNREVRSISSLVYMTLSSQISSGADIRVSVRRGSLRS